MSKENIYIAYGSNLNLPQMSMRCPDAEVYIMPDHHRLGMPSQHYVNTLLEGYETADFDPHILYEALRCGEPNPCRFLPTNFPLSCRNPLVNTPVFPAVLSFARKKSEGKNCVAPISLQFLWAFCCEGGSLAGARRRRQSQKHQKGLLMGDSGSTPRTLNKTEERMALEPQQSPPPPLFQQGWW